MITSRVIIPLLLMQQLTSRGWELNQFLGSSSIWIVFIFGENSFAVPQFHGSSAPKSAGNLRTYMVCACIRSSSGAQKGGC